MSTLYAIPSPPAFATGNDLHATDGVQLLWDTARYLDMASLAPRDLFQGHADHRHEYVNENPLRYWSGGARYWTGLTTMTFVVDHAVAGVAVTPRLRVYVNDTLRLDQALVSGLQSYSVASMGAWGLTSGQVLEIRAEIVDIGLLPGPDLPADRSWGRYYLVDAYLSPASAILTDAWPGLPVYATGPDETRMRQLGNAGLWLTRRMALVPQPLFQRIVSSPELPWWTPSPGDPIRHIWSGGLGVGRGVYDRIRSRVVWLTGSATNQRIRMLINGSEVATTGNLSASTWGVHTFDVNISGYGTTTPLRVELELVITAGVEPLGYPNRITVEYVEAHIANPPFQALTFRPTPWEQTTWAVRRSRLQNIAGWLETVKGRVDANPDRWDRIRLFRSSYAYDPKEAQYLQGRYQAVRRYRTGARLVVRGSNLKLGWGPLNYKLNDEKEPFGEYAFDFGFSETLVGGNDVETREVALDALPGLVPGMQYTVYGGDVRYAVEEQR